MSDVRVQIGILGEQTTRNALGQAQRVVTGILSLAARVHRRERQRRLVVAARCLVLLAWLEQLRHARWLRRRRIAAGIFRVVATAHLLLAASARGGKVLAACPGDGRRDGALGAGATATVRRCERVVLAQPRSHAPPPLCGCHGVAVIWRWYGCAVGQPWRLRGGRGREGGGERREGWAEEWQQAVLAITSGQALVRTTMYIVYYVVYILLYTVCVL